MRLEDYTCANIRGILSEKDNLEILEHLTFREFAMLKKLKRDKNEGKLDFGKTVKQRDMRGLLKEVSEPVNHLLGTDVGLCKVYLTSEFDKKFISSIHYTIPLICLTGIGLCGLSSVLHDSWYFTPTVSAGMTSIAVAYAALNHFLWSGKKSLTSNYTPNRIRIAQSKMAEVLPTLAHEYAHHVIDMKIDFPPWNEAGIAYLMYQPFFEGIARGAQKHIAYSYSKDNESFMYNTLKINYKEFFYAYHDIHSMLTSKNNCLAGGHALGNAYFSIEEFKHGKDVYRKALDEVAETVC